MRRAPILVALVAGCAWSNSLYQARTLSNEATRDEQAHRTGDAQSLWGQVAVKAETAYARAPQGRRGAEALWLVGHGEARSGDCLQGAPALQRALLVDPAVPWRQELLLELGQCETMNRDPAAVDVYSALLREVTDSAIRRQAHLHQGHLLVAHGEWAGALRVLESDDTLPARLDRATAFANLGQTGAALRELQPAITAGDTAVGWASYVDAFAAHDTAATDSLLTGLLAMHTVTPLQRGTWLLGAAENAPPRDSLAAGRWLMQLAQLPSGRPVIDGRMLQLQWRMTRAHSLSQLQRGLDTVHAAGRLPLGSLVAARVEGFERMVQIVVVTNDSVTDGAPRGDLALLMLAGFARDSLGSVPISNELLERLERGWPTSPYVGKALMARITMQPDSSAALLARFQAHAGNPYVEAASGDIGARVQVAQLEDSLGNFADTHPLRARATVPVIQ